MDSANSGTSSGGDEEYDSRAAADSFFSNTHQPPPPVFDPLSTYIHHNSLLLNPNISWPGPIRPNHAVMLPTQTPVELNRAARNPKKRARASRRAPTTVLKTDPTNFRAMVQEFTGIPAQPFSTSRLGIMRSAASEAPYDRRPFGLKVQSPPPISNLFRVQNPRILQSNPNFIFSNSSNQTSFQIPSNDHFHVHTSLPNLISPDQVVDRNDNTEDINNGGDYETWIHGACERRRKDGGIMD